MRILLTNDDGINAPGLKVLEDIAAEIAGPTGEVWVVAPAFEQSGVSHCISYAGSTMVSELAPRRWAAEGSPADCVLAGLYHVLPDRPDLILSGVNRGNNSGENTLYSGTIGGALEGALQGIPSIALSQFYGPRNVGLENQFEAAAAHGVDVVRRLIDHGDWTSGDWERLYNVNFPPIPAAEVTGVDIVRQGRRPTTRFGMESQTAPNGRTYLWVTGGAQDEDTGPDSDVRSNVEGAISVTPMTPDLTDYAAMESLKDAFR